MLPASSSKRAHLQGYIVVLSSGQKTVCSRRIDYSVSEICDQKECSAGYSQKTYYNGMNSENITSQLLVGMGEAQWVRFSESTVTYLKD